MIEKKYLLTDDQIAQFITHGYVQLETDFTPEFHQLVVNKMSERVAFEGNPGNNLVPRVPEVQQIFDHPMIRGALTSVLGPNYFMHAHRHAHLRPGGERPEQGTAAGNTFVPPDIRTGGWHKDNYWNNEKTRGHYPWSAMIFYFPQDVTEDMGVTGIMAGSQYRYKLDYDKEINVPIVGKAGTFALISYDLWHRATANVSNIDRFMLKFIFFRLEAPQKPEWNNQRKAWKEPKNMLPITHHPLMWENIWNWMSGSIGMHGQTDSLKEITELEEALHGDDETQALNAAYELATIGEKGISILIKGLMQSSPDVVHPLKYSVTRVCAHGLAASGAAAIPALSAALEVKYEQPEILGQIAYALGEMREQASQAVPKLIEMLQEDSAFTRQHVVEALGMIKEPTNLIVPALNEALKDADMFVRQQAGLALARIGPAAEEAVPALKEAIYAANAETDVPLLSPARADYGARYVPAIASIALQRIGSKQAIDTLLHYLQSARWCPVTNSKNGF